MYIHPNIVFCVSSLDAMLIYFNCAFPLLAKPVKEKNLARTLSCLAKKLEFQQCISFYTSLDAMAVSFNGIFLLSEQINMNWLELIVISRTKK